jgi:hypothetical protein
VATTDFLALGGDDFPEIVGGAPAAGARPRRPAGHPEGRPEVHIDDAGPVLRDVVADYLARRGGELSPSDPRVFDPAHPRVALPTPRPVRCSP